MPSVEGSHGIVGGEVVVVGGSNERAEIHKTQKRQRMSMQTMSVKS